MTSESDISGGAANDLGADGAAAPNLRRNRQVLRDNLQKNFGQLAMAMGRLPRYRHHTIADLIPLVLDPLIRNRIAVATGQQGHAATLGFAIWASVSEAVDAKIKEQVTAGVFPVRLNGDEWISGDTKWLLDVIAPSEALAGRVLLAFGKSAGDGQVKIHPIVAQVVDRSLLEKLKVASAMGSAAGPE